MEEETRSFELRPPQPPDALPRPVAAPWLVAAGLALLVVCLVLALRRKTTPESARRAAFRRAERDLVDSRPPDVREAATFASLVLRRYLATAADDPALFETHEETLARHGALAGFDEAARSSAAACFARLSRLKYAPVPPAGDPAEVLADARTLLATLDRSFRA
jgi:hypothetical protein